MEYHMKELSEESLRLTEENWLNQAGNDIFELELKHHLDWAKGHILYNNEQTSFAYGIFKGDGSQVSHAEAIVEIIQSSTGIRVTKLLKLITSPRLWNDDDLEAMNDLLDVTTVAIQATLELGGQNKSRTIKYYGRNSSLLKILSSVNKRLNQLIDDPTSNLHQKVTSRIVDRWLEIKISQ